MPTTFSNPRLLAEFTDWPSGSHRVRCVFAVERSKKGFRISRTTTGKPKYSRYNGPSCIVDGEDGRTYLLSVAEPYGFISIHRSDFLSADPSSVFPRDGEAYQSLMALIVHSGAPLMPVA